MTTIDRPTVAPGDTSEQSPAQHFIGGRWMPSDAVGESVDPSTGRVIGRFSDGGAAEAQAAIDAARTAFDTTSWSVDTKARSAAISALADALERRAPELAAMLSRENGKLGWETGWEVANSVVWLRYYAAVAQTGLSGRSAEVAPGLHFRSNPEPLGVAGIISPWNSPVILTVRALAPALGAGCTTIVKMPAQTALTNALFADIVASVPELPAGVVNIFTESGNSGAPLLVQSRDVDVISYTGSTAIGRRIAQAGAPLLKRMNLELGGKTPMIVFDDADLEATLETLVRSVTMMNGQFCVTGSRVLVQRSIADTVRERLTAAIGSVRPGRNDDPDSQLGPLVDAASARRVDAIVAESLSYATPLVRGGLVTEGPLAESGAFYRPSLLEVSDLNSRIVQEEIFGPVQTFEVFEDEADAIRRANATEFGLGACIFTSDAARAKRVGRAVQAATVWINTWGVINEEFEQGGYKQSGVGYLAGPRAMEQFQELKVYAEIAAPIGAE